MRTSAYYIGDNNIEVKVTVLAAMIHHYGTHLRDNYPVGTLDYGAFYLRITNTGWETHKEIHPDRFNFTGLIAYECVPRGVTQIEAREIAYRLCESVSDKAVELIEQEQ